ncbi:MAG TPA: hypothetical protein VMS81_03250 [Methanomicrobiales archaeon]|jgi:hypothetical protein|nr:hypothetical protein [Methanomicrobiales archaeon]
MDAFSHRTWIPFYLFSFGTVSIAVLRSMNGVILLFTLLLVAGALGVIFLTIQAEVARNTEKKELMEVLSKKALEAADHQESEAK